MSKYKSSKKKWELVEPGIIYKVRCCDCGLVHEYVYQVTKKGEIYVATKRDNRATVQVRRHMKKEV